MLHGLLWLYPDHSADAWLAAIDAVPNTASRELLSGDLEIKSPWFQRDMPMSLDTLVENFLVGGLSRAAPGGRCLQTSGTAGIAGQCS